MVLGRSSPIQREVNLEYCAQHQIPVIRRCSGGATIVTGQGCLMYSLLLDYRKRPQLKMLDKAHRFVMNSLIESLRSLGIATEMHGTCDLVFGERKVSGNALRCKRNFFLYHGTLLHSLPIGQIAECLGQPKRQPDYRKQRSHNEFIGHLPTNSAELKTAITQSWNATELSKEWPSDLTQKLVAEKYSQLAWTHRH